jgi:Arc/MetJ family transcription regulator
MKTTLDIPEDLLAEAMAVAGVRTKREAVVQALEDFNRRAKLRTLARRLGRSKTFMDFEELMRLRARETSGIPDDTD